VKTPLVLLAALVWAAVSAWADPALSDHENFERGTKLHNEGKYQEAYDRYFKDLTPTPMNEKWLKDYRAEYLLSSGDAPADGNGGFKDLRPPGPGKSRKPYSLVVRLGMDVPTTPSDFSTYWKGGMCFGVEFGRKVGRLLTISLDLSQHRFPVDEKAYQDYFYALTGNPESYNIHISGGRLDITSFQEKAKIHFSGRDPALNGFFTAGLGYGWVVTHDALLTYQGDSQPAQGSSEGNLYVSLGLGMDMRLAPGRYLTLEYGGASVATKGDPTGFAALTCGFRYDL